MIGGNAAINVVATKPPLTRPEIDSEERSEIAEAGGPRAPRRVAQRCDGQRPDLGGPALLMMRL
jgi:hypothetical protein